MQQKFTLFNPSGIPVRATLTLSFKEYKTLEEQLKELNLQSADHTKRRVVRSRDTLARIAFEEYGDASQWRLIADHEPNRRRARRPAPAAAGRRAGDPGHRRPRSEGTPAMSVTASAAMPIYEGQDFYVPAFEVRLAGRPAGQDVVRDILSVTYKDSVQDIDSFEIAINNWDAETRAFKYSDQRLFDPGERVELHMGYQGALRPMLTGEITSLRPSFPSGGGSTLAVSGLNILHRFRTQQESRTYVDHDRQPDRRADRRTAQGQRSRRHASTDEPTLQLPDPGQPVRHHLPDGAGAAGRLRPGRRGAQGRAVEPRPSSSTSRRPRCTTPTYRLTYGKSLIEFQPELTTANQVGKVTVRGWDALQQGSRSPTPPPARS